MRIRDIKAKDKRELLALMADFYENTEACLHRINMENCDATFELCLKDNTYARMVVAEDEYGVQGYCLLSFTWSNEAGGMVVLIEEIYFKENARGKGYGKAILTWIEQEYPKAKRFRLEATYNNKGAISLYEREGYEELAYFQMIKEKK